VALEEPVEDACVRGLAALYVAGAAIDWSRAHGASPRFVRLPASRWRHERCWFAEPVQEPERRADRPDAGKQEACHE
jgi:acyl transferase domain-containing protein